MIDLSIPPRREELNAALLAAFDRTALERLVRFSLPYRLTDLVGNAAGDAQAVFVLVEAAERAGELEPLLRGAVRANPASEPLRTFCVKYASAALAAADPAGLVDRAASGLAALAGAGAGEATGEFRATFRAVERQTRRLAAYKGLHDELHQLQMRLGPIEDAAAFFVGPPPVPPKRLLLTREVVTLRGQATRARQLARQLAPGAEPELDWCDQLDEAAAELGAAVEGRDAARAGQAALTLRQLLQSSYRIEGLIATAAGETPLGELVAALRAIAARVGGPAADGARAGADALAALRPQLAGMVAEHAEWQFLSKELAGIDVNPGPKPTDKVPRRWPRVRTRLEALWEAFRSEPWAAELRAQVLRWEAAADAGRNDECDEAAAAVRAVQMNRFFDADRELLRLCGRLTEIGAPLRALLGD